MVKCLIYSKVVTVGTEKVTKLFGTVESIPAATDNELVYKDKDGDIVELAVKDIYVDNDSRNNVQRIRRISDGKPLTVYIKKADSTLVKIIGDDPVEKVLEKIVIKTQATTKEFKVGETFSRAGLKINKVYADGDKVEALDNEVSADLDNYVFAEGDISDAKVVTITCAGKTITYKIKVVAA